MPYPPAPHVPTPRLQAGSQPFGDTRKHQESTLIQHSRPAPLAQESSWEAAMAQAVPPGFLPSACWESQIGVHASPAHIGNQSIFKLIFNNV